MVGALSPSSRFLAKKMVDHLPLKDANVIVELGPGTGVFTHRIIEKMGKSTQLIVIELNDEFYISLKKQFQHLSNVHVFHRSAEDIPEILKELHLDTTDYVISSLPLAMFPKELARKILDTSKKVLQPQGKYIQFQYSLQSKNALKTVFSNVKLSFTVLNIPPAFVYTCSI